MVNLQFICLLELSRDKQLGPFTKNFITRRTVVAKYTFEFLLTGVIIIKKMFEGVNNLL